MTSFFEQLEARSKSVDSLLCVGLDPHKQELEENTAAGVIAFCTKLIEATSAVAAAYKPNAAFFEALGSEGIDALHTVIAAVPAGIPVILDAKRGDIGSTADAYAMAAFDSAKAHAITASPYMGTDSLEPFLKDKSKGCFILCKTSNPGSNDLQTLPVKRGMLYEEVASIAQSKWNGNNNIGLVVGATDTLAMSKARAAAPELWVLAPGVGFQGGSLEESVAAGLRKDGMGLLLPVSRGISRAKDPAAAAVQFRDQINVARAAAMAAASPDAGPSMKKQKTMLAPYQAEFIEFAMGLGVLKFGSFTLKSGRTSPYFFNAGLFKSGNALGKLGQYYAHAIEASGIPYEVLFGPAYKGIPLVSAIAIALATETKDVDFAYNRKEAKDHGEGGIIVGAEVAGKSCLLVDDVISAGTAIREAMGILTTAKASLAGVVISLDRQERTGAAGAGAVSAIQQVEADMGVQVVSIVTLSHLVEWSKGRADMQDKVASIVEYQREYGVGAIVGN